MAFQSGTPNSVAIALALFLVTAVFLFATWPSRYGPNAQLEHIDGTSQSAERRPKDGHKKHISVQVVVLGDVGRSPRMQYHAISLAKHGARVYIIGYVESELHPSILSSPLITIIRLPPPPRRLRNAPHVLFPLLGPLKAIHQALALYRSLNYLTPATTYTLMQNPPAIPVLLIALITTALRNTRLVIDWHNLGYTVLALRFNNNHFHPLVRLARFYELTLARFAAGHFTVSEAMAEFLEQNISGSEANPLVLYDRPAAAFQPIISPHIRAEFLRRLPQTAPQVEDLICGSRRLIVTSTSWSADEDFDILFSALVEYSHRADRDHRRLGGRQLPRILAIITGKGPRQAYYLKRVSGLEAEGALAGVDIKTAWLSHEDYAGLLACADLGLSLHRSTSGLDLPMKVVDMFGAGLPVAGWSGFESWPELVKNGVNGLGFVDSQELVDVFFNLFDAPRGGREMMARLKEGAIRESSRRWDDEWDAVAGKVLGLVT